MRRPPTRHQSHAHERNVPFAILTVLTVGATVALVLLLDGLLVPLWVVVAVAVPYVALSIYLRIHRDDVGREGRYLDLWSIPHLLGGALLALLGVPLVWVAILVVWWELVEVACRIFEHLTNRVTDIALALLGWAGAHSLVTA